MTEMTCRVPPLLLFGGLLLAAPRLAAGDLDSCTTVGVTAGASSAGSTMVTHTSDCAQCDTRVAYIPARVWAAGARRPIYPARLEYPREVSDRAGIYRPVGDQNLSVSAGTIPQVSHTYGYWEAVYGYMNEHGLGLGESTAASNFPVARANMTALMWIRPLTQVALERCKTARCAVETMGRLAEEYGFYGEDPGAAGGGECLILADGKEVWVFEITGDDTQRSAFWAAKRVPDGHVVAIANNFVIREVDCDDRENFMCSRSLPQKAKEAGAWDGEGKFDWMVAMAPDIRSFSYMAGMEPIPMYTTARRWRIFSRVAPGAGFQLTANPYVQPFSVRSEDPVSHRFLMDLKRDHYEGTEIDLTEGPLAGPFGSPNRAEGGVGLRVVGGQFARAISLPRTSYCSLCQSFAAKGAGSLDKFWFAADSPASSVFVPFYTNVSGYAETYGVGHMAEYDDRSAWWTFDFVANWMDLNYKLMSVDVTEKLQALQDRIDAEAQPVEAAATKLMARGGAAEARTQLAAFQTELQDSIVSSWRKFGQFLIMKYNDGRLNYPTVAAPIGYPGWWLQVFGVDANVEPKWCSPSAEPPSFFQLYGAGPFEKVSPTAEAKLALSSTGSPQPREDTVDGGSGSVLAFASYGLVFAVGCLVGRAGRWTRADGRGARLVAAGPEEGLYYAAPLA